MVLWSGFQTARIFKVNSDIYYLNHQTYVLVSNAFESWTIKCPIDFLPFESKARQECEWFLYLLLSNEIHMNIGQPSVG
jgi:hypothetical protein